MKLSVLWWNTLAPRRIQALALLSPNRPRSLAAQCAFFIFYFPHQQMIVVDAGAEGMMEDRKHDGWETVVVTQSGGGCQPVRCCMYCDMYVRTCKEFSSKSDIMCKQAIWRHDWHEENSGSLQWHYNVFRPCSAKMKVGKKWILTLS